MTPQEYAEHLASGPFIAEVHMDPEAGVEPWRVKCIGLVWSIDPSGIEAWLPRATTLELCHARTHMLDLEQLQPVDDLSTLDE